jgi:FHS family glucose/mannose:H+ symporter-like MFS transporter
MPSPFRRAGLFVSACAGIFVFGSTIALFGTLFGLPGTRERLGIDLAGQGDLFFVQFLGIFISTSLAGPLIDRFGKRVILAACAGLIASALVGFALASTFGAAAVAAWVLGLGSGGLNTACNVLVSDLYDIDRSLRLNVLGVCYAFGALFVPLASAALTDALGVRPLLALSAVPALACTGLYAALPFPAPREAHAFSLRRAAGVLRYPGVALFGLILFCQSGNEGALAGWTSTYVGQRGWSSPVAGWMLTTYWLALLLGRLAATFWLVGAEGWRVLLACGIGSAIGASILVAASSLWQIAVGVMMLGLSFANVYPATLAMVGSRYTSFTGSLFGALFAMGLFGGMLFPWAMGQVAERLGVRAAMTIPLVGAVVICAAVLAQHRRNGMTKTFKEPERRSAVRRVTG